FGARKDPGRLVVPDRLRGQAVPTRQVNRPEPFTVSKVSPHCPAATAGKDSINGSTIPLRVMTAAVKDAAHAVDAATVMGLLPTRPRLIAPAAPTHGEDGLLDLVLPGS